MLGRAVAEREPRGGTGQAWEGGGLEWRELWLQPLSPLCALRGPWVREGQGCCTPTATCCLWAVPGAGVSFQGRWLLGWPRALSPGPVLGVARCPHSQRDGCLGAAGPLGVATTLLQLEAAELSPSRRPSPGVTEIRAGDHLGWWELSCVPQGVMETLALTLMVSTDSVPPPLLSIVHLAASAPPLRWLKHPFPGLQEGHLNQANPRPVGGKPHTNSTPNHKKNPSLS